ncbi:MAG: hypothetical protein HQK61_05510 [Desulfamplus sp.]|nr:hypothetical protein [Desulfamplus sp.]
MITITLRLSQSLLSILNDVNNPRPETCYLQVKQGTTIKEVLLKEGINPLLAPMVSIDNIKVDIDTVVETDKTITVYGPLAGG